MGIVECEVSSVKCRVWNPTRSDCRNHFATSVVEIMMAFVGNSEVRKLNFLCQSLYNPVLVIWEILVILYYIISIESLIKPYNSLYYFYDNSRPRNWHKNVANLCRMLHSPAGTRHSNLRSHSFEVVCHCWQAGWLFFYV